MDKKQIIFNVFGFTLLLTPIIIIILKAFTDVFDFMYDMNPIPIVIGTIIYMMVITILFGSMLSEEGYFIPIIGLIVYLMLPIPPLVYDSLNDELIESTSKDSFYYKMTLSKIVKVKEKEEMKEIFKKYNLPINNLNGFIIYNQDAKHRGLILELDSLYDDLSSFSDFKEVCDKNKINCLVADLKAEKYIALNDFKIENTQGKILVTEGKEIPNNFEIKIFKD